MPDPHEAEELRDNQRRREQLEHQRAAGAEDDDEAREHERRSEKARYLREKLQDRVESERDR